MTTFISLAVDDRLRSKEPTSSASSGVGQFLVAQGVELEPFVGRILFNPRDVRRVRIKANGSGAIVTVESVTAGSDTFYTPSDPGVVDALFKGALIE